MATAAEIERGIRKAIDRGDLDLAKELGNRLRVMQGGQTTQQSVANEAARDAAGQTESSIKAEREFEAQPWWKQALGATRDMSQIIPDSLSFGLVDALQGTFAPWSEGVEAERKATQEARDRSDGADIGMDIASAWATGKVPGMKFISPTRLAPKGPGFVKGAGRAGLTAAEGGLQAGLSSLGHNVGEGKSTEELLTDAGVDAAAGAVTGAGIHTAASGLSKVFARGRAARDIARSPFKSGKDIAKASKDAYDQVRNAGGVYPAATVDNWLQSIPAILQANKATKGLNDRAYAVTQKLWKDHGGRDLDPEELDKVRQWVRRELVQPNYPNPMNPSASNAGDLKIGEDIIKSIDDVTGTKSIVGPGGAPVAQNVDMSLKEGRSRYFQRRRLERVQQARAKATQTAAETGSGIGFNKGNWENRQRQEARKLVERSESGRVPRFPEPEKVKLQQIGGRSLLRDAGRVGSVVSPLRGGIPLMLWVQGKAAQAMTRPESLIDTIPYELGGVALAEGVNQAGQAATRMRLNQLETLIRTGIDPAGDPNLVHAGRQELARLGTAATARDPRRFEFGPFR